MCHAVFDIYWSQKCVNHDPSVILSFHFLSTHVTCDISDLLIQLLHLAHQTSEIVMPTRVSTSAVSSFSPSICTCDQTILMHMYCCEHKILVMDLLNTTYFKLHTPDACLKDLGNFFRWFCCCRCFFAKKVPTSDKLRFLLPSFFREQPRKMIQCIEI